MSSLKDFINKQSKFVTITEEPIIFTIADYQETVDSFGNPSISYKVQLDGEAEYKTLQKGSVRFARKVMALPNEGKGCKVRVSKRGEKFDTQYEVELVEG